MANYYPAEIAQLNWINNAARSGSRFPTRPTVTGYVHYSKVVVKSRHGVGSRQPPTDDQYGSPVDDRGLPWNPDPYGGGGSAPLSFSQGVLPAPGGPSFYDPGQSLSGAPVTYSGPVIPYSQSDGSPAPIIPSISAPAATPGWFDPSLGGLIPVLGFLAPEEGLIPELAPLEAGSAVLETIFPWLAVFGAGALLAWWLSSLRLPYGLAETRGGTLQVDCGGDGDTWIANQSSDCQTIFTYLPGDPNVNPPLIPPNTIYIGAVDLGPWDLNPIYNRYLPRNQYQMGPAGGPPVQTAPYPMEIGRTWPLGVPGINPAVIPSVMPGLFPPGLPLPSPVGVPYRSIPEFDRGAVEEWSPYIQREVGPGPGVDAPSGVPWFVPDVGPLVEPDYPYPFFPAPGPGVSPFPDVGAPVPAPYMPPGVDPYAPPPPGLEPYAPPGSMTDIHVSPDPGGSTYYPTPPDAYYQAPPGGRKERKLRGSTHAIRMLLAAATYAGGTVRALHQSLPKKCRSKAPGGRRRYDSMLSDIYRCLDQVDWDKFQNLLAEMLSKYAIEGAALKSINAASTASGYGLATNLYHAMGPDVAGPLGGSPSSSGGPFSGRQDPFQGFGAAFGWANRNAGI